jgi:hypothetical protein
MNVLALTRSPERRDESFLLQCAQSAMTGLIDGSLSTLAPIFTVASATRQPQDAAWIGWRFFGTGFLRSFVSIALGGAIIASVSAALPGARLSTVGARC